jgi:hypothetical protein
MLYFYYSVFKSIPYTSKFCEFVRSKAYKNTVAQQLLCSICKPCHSGKYSATTRKQAFYNTGTSILRNLKYNQGYIIYINFYTKALVHKVVYLVVVSSIRIGQHFTLYSTLDTIRISTYDYSTVLRKLEVLSPVTVALETATLSS